MSATFKNLIVAPSVVALIVLASEVSAAPSLGINRPYYGSTNNRSSARSFRSYAPSYSTETRQSFSYEPAQNGVTVNGHCHRHAMAPQVTKKADTKQDTAVPQATRRSYSYEPATPAPQGRVNHRRPTNGKEAWQLQKTDPRRNQ